MEPKKTVDTQTCEQDIIKTESKNVECQTENCAKSPVIKRKFGDNFKVGKVTVVAKTKPFFKKDSNYAKSPISKGAIYVNRKLKKSTEDVTSSGDSPEAIEKSASTDDFPKLLRKTEKTCQESQTDTPSKQVKIQPAKIPVTRPAYSTALTKSFSAKTVPTIKKVEPSKPFTKFCRPTGPNRTLARSKTVGDIKSGYQRPLNRAELVNRTEVNNRTEAINRTELINKPKQPGVLTKSKTSLSRDQADYASSVETLVNQPNLTTNSSNSIASSSETLNNDNTADGWLTVKCRSRFKNSGKGKKCLLFICVNYFTLVH